MEGGVNELKDYALSDSDIRHLLGDDIAIHTYPELQNMRSVDELFDSKGRAIVLWLTNSPTEGHWTCLMRKRKGIEFWDPYGDPPGEQIEDLSKARLQALDQNGPFLTKLLRGSGRPVYYNTHQYQKLKDGVNTCGRWCVARLMYAPKSEEYFKGVVDKSGMEPDTFVSALIANYLGK